jgi:hypothetical protein
MWTPRTGWWDVKGRGEVGRDRLVYELYGLTDEEVRIVEEASN